MNETIMVALISGLSVGIPSVIATFISNNKNQTLMNYRIEELTKQVERHNSVIERTALLEHETKALWRSLGEMKEDGK